MELYDDDFYLLTDGSYLKIYNDKIEEHGEVFNREDIKKFLEI
jgi:hypothetical protein